MHLLLQSEDSLTLWGSNVAQPTSWTAIGPRLAKALNFHKKYKPNPRVPAPIAIEASGAAKLGPMVPDATSDNVKYKMFPVPKSNSKPEKRYSKLLRVLESMDSGETSLASARDDRVVVDKLGLVTPRSDIHRSSTPVSQ